jgi:GAF domain-containing protein/HAMP domain-containing protein
LGIVGVVALGAIAVAVGVSLLVTRGIAGPLANLTETAAQVAAGNLALSVPVESRDEIGALAGAFNTMTVRLRDLVGSLEERVAERTRELEQRSTYLEASADVARAAGSVLDPEELVRQAVDLIRDRFDLYYVGLFLADETEEWAIMRAGTGEAGRAMLARGHRIRVGEGMVGWSIANAQSRITSRAEADAVRLAIPELPETRSEAALPLRSRGQVLGALSVQATDPEAFDEEMIVVLQTMADQVAVALDNARLFAASQQALEAERRAYGEISREAWARLIGSQVAAGYRADERGVAPAVGSLPPEVQQAIRQGQAALDGDGEEPAMAVPIPVRDQVIGTLKFRKPGGGDWAEDEIALLEGMAAQLGQALESARLYQDTQRRAARDRLIGEVTAHMRETLELEDVLKTAASEMRQALGLEDLVIRLKTPEEDDGSG